MLRAAPAPQVTVSAEAARSAERKLAALAVAAENAPQSSRPEPIRLTTDEVDSYLAEHFPMTSGMGAAPERANSSVRDVRLTFSGDQARLYVRFELLVKDVTLQLAGRLHVAGGYLRFEITDGSLGYLTLPGWALDQGLAPYITEAEVRNQLRVPDEIRDIRVENGELVIERQ